MADIKATRQQTKLHNRDLVIRTIFDNEPISRADIARTTKLTRTTVSEIVARLMGEGLVEEVGQGSSIGGKRSILLSLVADSRYLIGVNIAQENFIGSIVNLRGEIKDTVSIPVQGNDGHKALELIYGIIDRLFAKGWLPVVGIGVGAPGLINSRDGVIINAVNLDWQDLPLAGLLENRYQVPVTVLNDSQATAMGEYVYGEHGSDKNLVVVNVRHGIGAGILIDGRLFQGDDGGAGEIGHVVVEEDGLVCRCGQRGCLETVASAKAVCQKARVLYKSPEPVSLDMLLSRFESGDAVTRQIVVNSAHFLGKAIGSLIGVLNIKKIVLTGDMPRFGPDWLAAVKESIMKSALNRLTHETTIEVGQLDYRACILGASAYLLQDSYSILFTQPEK